MQLIFMGAWGTGILQNDTTADIWAEFKELYNAGLSPKEIRIKLEKEYKPQRDTEYYGEIWSGIAHGQWMCGELETYTLNKLKSSTGKKWLTLWAEDKELLQKRIVVLQDFIKKLKKPRPTPLKRKRIVNRPAQFKRGDVIALKIDHESYLAGIVLQHDSDPLHGQNIIAITDLVFKDPPSKKQIETANILYLDKGGSNYYHRGFFSAIFASRNMVKKAKDTIKIASLEFDSYLSFGIGIGYGDWNKVGELYFEQVDFLKSNHSDKPFRFTVKDMLDPKKKRQDQLFDWSKKLFLEEAERQAQKYNKTLST